MICARCHRRYEGDTLFCPHDGERLVTGLDIKRIRARPTEVQGTVVVGRYQIRGLIGKGAMAHVFLALDQTSGTPVALKILDSKHVQDKSLVARFILEAKAAAHVVHRSIVEILDVGLGPERAPFLVMEFLLGESLGEYLRREKTMAPDLGLPFVRSVAEGLAAVHRAGIVHRDVKPDNVFLIGEKKSPHAAKIVDFGFAKLEEQGALTQAGVTVGTVEYMSPEQAVSDPVDARTDVYGLGALMYRMFAGRLPFGGVEHSFEVAGGRVSSHPPDPAEVLARHFVEDLPSMSLTGQSSGPLSAGIEAIIRKAMRKRPEHRYASMEALLGDLSRLERGESLSASLPLEEADVYAPRSAFSTKAGGFLHRRLGKEPRF